MDINIAPAANRSLRRGFDLQFFHLLKVCAFILYHNDDNRRFHVDKPQRTLILLHVLEGNHSYWNRYTSVERYAQQRNLALIMPEAEMSMYSDMKCGLQYGQYIGEELPELITKMFRINTDREHLSIAAYQSVHVNY